MSINLKLDLMGNTEPPSIVLANRNGNKLGQLNVNTESIDVKGSFKAADEFTFTLNKYIDGKITPLWNKVVDFKLVYCPEWDEWFEIKVELDEATETVKTILCTQLGQAELSQLKLYDVHINEEGDPNWNVDNETYKSTILYDENNTEISLLHRLLKDKAPHYSIVHVDETIQRIQKTFSFNSTSICDAFDEIAEEIGCLFVYHSNSTKDGKPNRAISVYDLQQKCNSCGYRGEFTEECPKCKSKDITYGYGEDTTIFVTSDELATEGVQLVTDTDSVKNCFKLEAGDDLMTTTIRNCNPNGSGYIWYFSDAVKEDMPNELVKAIEEYDRKYQECYHEQEYLLNTDLVRAYNNLVDKYKDYYNTPSTCLNCNNEGYFEGQCPNCNSENILTGKTLQSMPTTIVGYPSLMTAYYNTIDLLLYLKSGLMPNVEMSETDARTQVGLLTASSISPVAVNVEEITDASEATAKSAVLSMAKTIVKSTYKVDVVEGSSSLSGSVYSDANGKYRIWTGKFVVTNYSDDNDTATGNAVSIRVNNDTETFIEQKINKALNKTNTDDYSISGLFAMEYNAFCAELKKYALNPLDNFSNACETCLSILYEQGAGDKDEKPDLYEKLYKPYFDKQQAINNEIKIRQSDITIIEGSWKTSDDGTKTLSANGLQTDIERCQKEIQKELDFESYLGQDLWLILCSYRREDEYSNSNYISDGLNNAELFEKANEFIEVAENEIFKSAELQHSISATLNNLLIMPKFKPLVKHFKTGNWIRVQVDDKVYKLRLIEYGINFGKLNTISVDFSDVTKIKNGITDVRDILSQASSMASSYDSVQRQAQKGDVARSTIDQWIVDGLDSANVQIKSNNDEEILLTKNGLLARSYDDITGTYSPEQFKLTHNIMAYTTDGWETASAAFGKHDYKYWNGTNFVDGNKYGLTSDFVNAGCVIGSQMVGGEIISSNYKKNESGTYFNLINGDFEIAGGNIVYRIDDNDESTLTLKNVTIEWSSSTKPEVNDITGLEEYLDQIGELEDQLDGRIQTYSQESDPSESWSTSEYANHVGDLWLNPIDGITKRWTGSGWAVVTDSSLTELAQSKAQIFTTTPTPPYYVGDLWVQGSTGDILHCIRTKLKGNSYDKNDWVVSSKYTDDSALKTFISGEYSDDLASIGNQIDKKARSWYQDTDPSLTWDKTEDHEGDLWYNSSANSHNTYIYDKGAWKQTSVPKELFDTIDGIASIYVTIPENPVNGDLLIPVSDIGSYKAGKVYRYNNGSWTEIKYTDDTKANEAYALADSAKSVADNAKNIGDKLVNGLGFEETEITGNYVISPVIAGGTLLIGDKNGTYAQITTDGKLICTNAEVSGVINAAKGGTIGGFTIGSDSIYHVKTSYNETSNDGVYIGTSGIGLGKGTFWVNKEGFLHAENAYIEGQISADEGFIGGFTIGNDYLYNGILGEDNSVFISTTDMEGESGFFDENINNWRLTVGSNFGVTSNGSLYANNANISGTITANDGSIGGWNIDNNSLYTTFSNSASRVFLSTGTSYQYTIGGHTDYWYIGAGTNNGNGFGVTTSGVLYANGANISGTINANDGYIGGWKIDDNVIESGSVQLCSSSNTSLPSLINDGESSIRIKSGENGTRRKYEEKNLATNSSLQWRLYQLDVPFAEIKVESVEVKALSNVRIEQYQVQKAASSNAASIWLYYSGGGLCEISYEYIIDGAGSFSVLDDGSLYALAANISGKIEANEGRIGSLKIKDGGIEGWHYGNIQYSINENGIRFNGSDALFEIGDLVIGYSENDKRTAMTAFGGLVIGSNNGTKLEFYRGSSVASEGNIKIHCQLQGGNGAPMKAQIWAEADSQLIYPITLNAIWQTMSMSRGSGMTVSTSLTINSGSATSSKKTIEFYDCQIRFKLTNGTWTNFVGTSYNDTNTYSFNNFSSYSQLNSGNELYLTGSFLPSIKSTSTTTGYNLGSTNYLWNTVYARTSTIQSSDKNKKNSILSLSEEYEQIFDSLKPVSYKYNVNNNNRTHIGFIAQDVKEAVESVGLTTQDFAAYCEWQDEDGEVGCGLRYSEFIAMCVDQIQKLKKRIEKLENKS